MNLWTSLGILWEFFSNSLGILWEFFNNFSGILREFFKNSLGILREFFGNSLEILRKLLDEEFSWVSINFQVFDKLGPRCQEFQKVHAYCMWVLFAKNCDSWSFVERGCHYSGYWQKTQKLLSWFESCRYFWIGKLENANKYDSWNLSRGKLYPTSQQVP